MRLPLLLFVLSVSTFLLAVIVLGSALDASGADHEQSRRTTVQAIRQPAASGHFAKVVLDAPIMANAASGLAIARSSESSSQALLAVANFYGESYAYALDTSVPGLAPRHVQSFGTKACHDWEAVTTPSGATHLIGAEYDAERSLVYQINDSALTGLPPPRVLEGWPTCSDSTAGCAGWAAAGECQKNPGFMLSSCAHSCDRCRQLEGPLIAVAALPGDGGTSARHVRIGRSTASVRELLLLSNYKAPAGQGVSMYEWLANQWRHRGYIDVPGAGELAHCRVRAASASAEGIARAGHAHEEQDHEDLIVFAVWNANGSFAASSPVYAVTTNANPAAAPVFTLRQALPTRGSHDAECFNTADDETYLLLLNGREDGGNRAVPSVLYRYDRSTQRFEPTQQLPTTGAHDAELVWLSAAYGSRGTAPPEGAVASSAEVAGDGTLLAVIANGASWSEGRSGDGEACDNAVSVWQWDGAARQFEPLHALQVGGCTTFARAWQAPARQTGGVSGPHGETWRTLLAIAVERTDGGADGKQEQQFQASVAMYEWVWDRSVNKPNRAHEVS